MYDDGYHNIVNIDFSKTVIENMSIKCQDRVGMECKEDSDQRANDSLIGISTVAEKLK